MTTVGGWGPTIALSGLAVLVLYRRASRLFRRQQFDPARLLRRLVLLGTACAALFVLVATVRGLLPTLGLFAGAALAVLGLTFTRFEVIEGRVHYTPNLYVSLGVLGLLVGRLAYRVIHFPRLDDVWATGLEVAADPRLAPVGGLSASPATSGIVFVLLGYYLCYYGAVLVRGRMLGRELTTR